MKKIIVFICSALMFISNFGTPIYAAEQPTNNNMQEETLNLLEEHGYDIVDSENIDEFIEFESVEEMEKYLSSIDDAMTNHTVEIPVNNLLRAGEVSDNDTVSWYSPFSGFDGLTLLCWSNVDFSYKYKFVSGRPQFVSVSKITSYLTGITMTSWSQRSYSTSFSKKYSTKDTCKATVNGTYKLGISISGFELGAKRNATWNASLTLVPA